MARPKLAMAGVWLISSRPNDSQLEMADSRVPSRLTAGPPMFSRIRMA